MANLKSSTLAFTFASTCLIASEVSGFVAYFEPTQREIA